MAKQSGTVPASDDELTTVEVGLNDAVHHSIALLGQPNLWEVNPALVGCDDCSGECESRLL
jgi:hypothetical protein